MKVSAFAIVQDDVDFVLARDERVDVLDNVWAVLQLPNDIDLVHCLQCLSPRHLISLQLFDDKSLRLATLWNLFDELSLNRAWFRCRGLVKNTRLVHVR